MNSVFNNIFNPYIPIDSDKPTIIGYDNYGCTIRPIINENIIGEYLKYENIDKSDVAKVFKNDVNSKIYFDNEFKLNMAIKYVDKNSIFSLKVKGANKFNSQQIKDEELRKYLKITDDNNILYQIIYENGGKEIADVKEIDSTVFISLFRKLLEGILLMHTNGLIHNDIKPSNVLMNNNKISLINYNLSVLANKLYTPENTHFLSQYNPFYPIEYYIASILIKYKDDSDEYKRQLEILPSYLDEIIKINDNNKDDITAFINDIKDKTFAQVFNDKLAYKADVYSLNFILRAISQNIIYNNENDKRLLYGLYKISSIINPNNRCTISDMIKLIDDRRVYNIEMNVGGRIPNFSKKLKTK